MRKPASYAAAVLAPICALNGCAVKDDPTGSSRIQYDVQITASAPSSLPKCTSALAGDVAYVSSPSSLWSCASGQWSQIPCNVAAAGDLAYAAAPPSLWACIEKQWIAVPFGDAGAPGPQGPTGPQGPQGPAGRTGDAGLESLILITAEAPGANCAAGGQKVQVGIDANGNGVLDASEVQQTAYVCNGQSASSDAGAGTCSAGQTNCNGTCTNTQDSDAANCGSCGHGCLGGTCSAGVCQRWTVANATTTSNPIYLAADANNVYVADDGPDAILQYPVSQAGATPTTLAQNSAFASIEGMIVSGSTLVFTTDQSHNLVFDKSSIWEAQVGVANQTLSALDSFDPATISGPAINGSTVYVLVDPEDSNGNHTTNTALYSCPTGTANACSSLVTAASNELGGPVFSGNAVFFDDFAGNTIEQFPLPSGPVNKTYVSPIPLTPTAMAADSSRIYFAYNGDGTGTTVTTEGIANNSTNGAAVPQGFANTTGSATGLASDSKFLYFAWVNFNTNPPTGAIQYAPVAGGAVSTLYTGTQPRDVIVANGGVYWIDGTNIYGQRVP
jgi:hypothetical protein